MQTTCPCGKQKSFEDCCGRFLSGRQNPKTPEQLMRSRYTAYALGGYGDYLLETWFPATAQGVTAEQLSKKSFDWQGLEVLNKSQSGDEGMVEFKAYLQPTAGGEMDAMHEKSEFKRLGGRWYYVGGRME